MKELIPGLRYNKLASMYDELVSEVKTNEKFSVWYTTNDWGAEHTTLFEKDENGLWHSWIVTYDREEDEYINFIFDSVKGD